MQIKILIVDDDLKIMNAVGKTFTTMLEGYLVLTATSANAGMSMLKEARPDVVVLDVRLGPESGMDLLEDYHGYLGTQKGRHRPRFIVMTAYPDENVKRQALERYKVDAFLMKPFDPVELRNKVIGSIRKILVQEDRYLAACSTEGKGDKSRVDRMLTEGPHQGPESGPP